MLGIILTGMVIFSGCQKRCGSKFRECKKIAYLKMDQLKDEMARVTDKKIQLRLEASECRRRICKQRKQCCEKGSEF